ncbi:hypothetical protein [Butyrivibrio proteoclasticus]|nr:hypothetical protein [Butyrivibrio proteoclasticus]
MNRRWGTHVIENTINQLYSLIVRKSVVIIKSVFPGLLSTDAPNG